MKNILLLFGLIALFSSCKATKKFVATNKVEKKAIRETPYVLTDDGKKTEAKTVVNDGRHIVADGVKFKKNDVLFYADSVHTYGKADVGGFAKKKTEGDLSLYTAMVTVIRSSTGPHGVVSTSTSRGLMYFIHKTGKPFIEPYSYKTAKKYILPGSPGFHYLQERQEIKRTYNRRKLYSFGVFAGSISLFALSDGALPYRSVGIVATGMCVGSVAAYIYNSIRKARMPNYLQNAIDEHNGYE